MKWGSNIKFRFGNRNKRAAALPTATVVKTVSASQLSRWKMRFAPAYIVQRLYVSGLRPRPTLKTRTPSMSLPNFPTSKPTDSVAQPVFVPTPQPTTADPASQAADQVQAVDQTVDQVQTQTADNSQATDNGQTPNLSTHKSRILGMEIDALTMEGAVDQLWAWINDSSQTQGCRYVVTPNVDHAVLLKENKDLQAAYRDAHLILADGHPVVLASKLLGQPVPERVAGSELVPRMFDFFNHYGDLKVFLLGAAEGVAEVAAKNMLEQWPKVQTVGVYSPPMGFEKDKVECANILQARRSRRWFGCTEAGTVGPPPPQTDRC